jgi:hypothetical protein
VVENPGTPDFNRECRQRGTKPHGRRGLARATLHFGKEVSQGQTCGKGAIAETRSNEPKSENLVSEVRPKADRHAGER